MTITQSLTRAYILAPLTAVAALMLLPLGLALGVAREPMEGVAVTWLLSIPLVAFALPLAYGGELLLVLGARAAGADPRMTGAGATLLASGASAFAVTFAAWLVLGRDIPWELTLVSIPAGVVGGASFLRLRKGVASARAI